MIGLQRHEKPAGPAGAGRQRQDLVLDSCQCVLVLQPLPRQPVRHPARHAAQALREPVELQAVGGEGDAAPE